MRLKTHQMQMFIVSEQELQSVRECFTHTKLMKILPVLHGLIILLICFQAEHFVLHPVGF